MEYRTDQPFDSEERRVSDALTVTVNAFRFSKGAITERIVALAKEVPFTLFVNDREILSISTLPTNLAELFVGFMVSEGVLISRSELIECIVDNGSRIVRMELDVPTERIDRLEGRGMLTSGCAGGLVFSVQEAVRPKRIDVEPFRIPCSSILGRMNELDTHKGIYSLTRGVHGASIAEPSRTLVILEDLGRHNAVDKIIGHCLLNDLDTHGKLLLTTGRITSEVLTKAARAGFPVIISRSSASAMAVSMAKQSGIDIITYVRAGRFDYFSHGAVRLSED